MKIGDFRLHFYNNWQKSTLWLNSCHGHHTRAVSLILTFWRLRKTPPSLKLLEQRVYELVGGPLNPLSLDNVVGSKRLRPGRIDNGDVDRLQQQSAHDPFCSEKPVPSFIFDSRSFRRKFESHCNRAVAMENQNALREDTAAKRNACALDIEDPKENTNMPNGTNDVPSLLLGILSDDKMSYKSFLKSQVGIISLGAFQVFCEARANTRRL